MSALDFLFNPVFWVVLVPGIWFLANMGFLDFLKEIMGQGDAQGEFDLGFTPEFYVTAPDGVAKIGKMKPGAIMLDGQKEWMPGFELHKTLLPEHDSVMLERKGMFYTNLGIYSHMVSNNPPGPEHIRQLLIKNEIEAEKNAMLERELIGHKADAAYKTVTQKVRENVGELTALREAVQQMGMTNEDRKRLREQGRGST